MSSKPDISNLSLDDIISAEQAANKKKKSKKAPATQPQINYENLSDDEIRTQLASRGLSTKGSRPKLVNRLKAEVVKAWAAFRKANKKAGISNLMPPSMPKKKPKKKLSEEERNKIHAENEANRLAKAKRRAENIKVQEENMRRKRQKREENAAKQAQLKQQQKSEKEARQRCEVYVQFDLEEYKKALCKKFDPSGKKIASISQEFSKKGFVMRFNDAKDAATATKGATMKKKKVIKTPINASMLPSPVESKCVFFQYPLDQQHPHAEAAKTWTESTNKEVTTELKKLQMWVNSAAKQFGKHGALVNIYRERGFLVLQYGDEKSAKKCFSQLGGEGADFNGVAFHHLRRGTPTKADRQECLKAVEVKEE